MAKYTLDFKIKVVQDYLNGNSGYASLAKIYKIPSKTSIEIWVKAYNKFGVDGLRRKKKDTIYSVHFKLTVLKYMEENNASLIETSHTFGLNNPTMIISWKKQFEKSGKEGLAKSKGRQIMSKEKTSRSLNINDFDESLEQKNIELKERIYLLELENLYLKKLKAFLGNPEDFLERDKSKLSKSSEI